MHWLRDPETGKYNFPEYLETIPRVEDFAFDRLPGFVPSSQDKVCYASVFTQVVSDIHCLDSKWSP